MTTVTINLVDQLAEVLGTNTMLDEVLTRLDQETLQKVIGSIVADHGLEVK